MINKKFIHVLILIKIKDHIMKLNNSIKVLIIIQLFELLIKLIDMIKFIFKKYKVQYLVIKKCDTIQMFFYVFETQCVLNKKKKIVQMKKSPVFTNLTLSEVIFLLFFLKSPPPLQKISLTLRNYIIKIGFLELILTEA